MRNALGFAVLASLLALISVSCFETPEPPPIPSPTPDIVAMVRAAVDAALGPTATPQPTYTARPLPTATLPPSPTALLPPTSTPAPPVMPSPHPTNTQTVANPTLTTDRLQPIPCEPPCDREYEPPWGYVDWQHGPSVSSSGVLTLLARIDDRINFIPMGQGGNWNNISITDGQGKRVGNVAPPGRDWVPRPGLWIASDFTYEARVLSVTAQIDPVAARHPGLEICIWSGGASREQNQLLDCVRLQQP